MGKIEKRKGLEDPGLKLPAPPPPSARGASYGASEVTAERWRAVTEAPRDRQEETSGAMAAHTGTGEELGLPGTDASSGENSNRWDSGHRSTEGPSGKDPMRNGCTHC